MVPIMNSYSVPLQVSLFNVLELLTPPSPTTTQSPNIAFAHYPSARLVSPFSSVFLSPTFFSGSRFCLSLAGSPVLYGRIEFVFLRMSLSPPTAPQYASRRTSCYRLQAGECIPEGDLHPSVHVRSQAHERRRPRLRKAAKASTAGSRQKPGVGTHLICPPLHWHLPHY